MSNTFDQETHVVNLRVFFGCVARVCRQNGDRSAGTHCCRGGRATFVACCTSSWSFNKPGSLPLTANSYRIIPRCWFFLQVVIDQVFWAPIFTLIFFTWIGITSGNSPSEIVNKVKSDLIQGVVGSWTVWPLAHTINFKYVPTEQRLLYINSIQIFYNVFLSIIGSK